MGYNTIKVSKGGTRRQSERNMLIMYLESGIHRGIIPQIINNENLINLVRINPKAVAQLFLIKYFNINNRNPDKLWVYSLSINALSNIIDNINNDIPLENNQRPPNTLFRDSSAGRTKKIHKKYKNRKRIKLTGGTRLEREELERIINRAINNGEILPSIGRHGTAKEKAHNYIKIRLDIGNTDRNRRDWLYNLNTRNLITVVWSLLNSTEIPQELRPPPSSGETLREETRRLEMSRSSPSRSEDPVETEETEETGESEIITTSEEPDFVPGDPEFDNLVERLRRHRASGVKKSQKTRKLFKKKKRKQKTRK